MNREAAVPRTDEVRILVTGGRTYANEAQLTEVLDGVLDQACTGTGRFKWLKAKPVRLLLIQGGAAGADRLAAAWAKGLAPFVQVATEKADWKRYGPKAAGPIRNQLMLDKYKPHLVVAFPGGNGTANMVTKAHQAGVPVVWAVAPVQRPSPKPASPGG